jgi:hypothetical protein
VPIPEVARGAILDAERLMRFREQVDVLVLYDAEATEILRVDHWWNLEAKRHDGRAAMAESHHLKVVEDEDGTGALDDYVARVKTVRYQAETSPAPVLSDVLTVTKVDGPRTGENREWTLTVTVEKAKGRYFQA